MHILKDIDMTLISEYGFTDGADSSGNGHTLNIVGSPSVAGGKNGKAAMSSATDRFRGLPGANVSLTDWTVMCWVKRLSATVSSYEGIFSNGNNFYFEFMNNGCTIECYSNVASHPNYPKPGPTVIAPIGTWIHVAVTRTTAGVSQIFIDGVSVVSGNGGAMNFGAGSYEVGCYDSGTSNQFPGLVDELRLFDTALNAAQITTWMNTPVGASSGGGSGMSTADNEFTRLVTAAFGPGSIRDMQNKELSTNPTTSITDRRYVAWAGSGTMIEKAIAGGKVWVDVDDSGGE